MYCLCRLGSGSATCRAIYVQYLCFMTCYHILFVYVGFLSHVTICYLYMLGFRLSNSPGNHGCCHRTVSIDVCLVVCPREHIPIADQGQLWNLSSALCHILPVSWSWVPAHACPNDAKAKSQIEGACNLPIAVCHILPVSRCWVPGTRSCKCMTKQCKGKVTDQRRMHDQKMRGASQRSKAHAHTPDAYMACTLGLPALTIAAKQSSW